MLTNVYLLDVHQHSVLASAIGRDEASAVARALDKARRQLRHLGHGSGRYLARNCRAHLVIADPTAQPGDGSRSYMLSSTALTRYLGQTG